MALSDLGREILTGSASALNADAITSEVLGYETMSLQISGTWSGVISFQASNDNVNFETVYAEPVGMPNDGKPIASTSINGIYHIPLNFRYFRARLTSYTSGTVSATAMLYLTPIAEPVGPMYTNMLDGNGTSIVSTIRSELRTTPTVKLVGETFEGSSLDANVWSGTAAGTGSIAISNGVAQLATGATANSSYFLASVHKGRYIDQTANDIRMNVRLGDAGIANNVRRWGAYDANNGVFFQLNGTTFGVGIRSAGVDTIITTFTGTSTPVVDTNFHSYGIQWTQSKVQFYQDGVLLYTYSVTTTAVTATPSLRIGAENTNSGGGTSNVSLYILAMAIFRYGQFNARERFFHSNFVGRVQSTSVISAGNVNTVSATFTTGSTAGNCLVAAVGISGAAISSITDNKGQTWTQATVLTSGAINSYIYYVPNSVAGVTTITVTLAVLTTSSIAIVGAEYFGVNATTPLDKTSTAVNSGTTALNSGSTAATTSAIELLFGSHYTVQSANDVITPGTGWTAITTIGGNGDQLYAQDQIVSATGTYASTGTAAAAHNFLSSIATFAMTIPTGSALVNFPQVLKTGPGTLRRIIINNPGTGSASIVIYDGTSTSGTEIANISLISGRDTLDFDLDFDNGLTVVVNSTTPDFTILYD